MKNFREILKVDHDSPTSHVQHNQTRAKLFYQREKGRPFEDLLRSDASVLSTAEDDRK